MNYEDRFPEFNDDSWDFNNASEKEQEAYLRFLDSKYSANHEDPEWIKFMEEIYEEELALKEWAEAGHNPDLLDCI